MLINRDLPTAHPLAVVERFAAGLIRHDSLLITEFVPDSADLETFLTRDVAAIAPAGTRRVRNRLIAETVRLLDSFHERGFAHRDHKAPNLLVTWRPPFEGRPLLTLIDMDGIRYVRRPTDEQRTQALARLCVSLLDSPGCTRTDRLRFLRAHLIGPGRTARQWKRHWRVIEGLCRIKQDHRERRRRWKLEHYGRQ